MRLETAKDVLAWFERQERSLTPEFIAGLEWGEVRKHPFDPRFVPVLLYMRDVEVLTDMYHEELRRTPTGKHPEISKFMERWGVEEITHGEVINRFLNELGYETPRNWKDEVHRAVTRAYHANMYFITTLTNLIGRRFTATHMAFGAIHEMTTGQAYRQMMRLADHPVLTKILEAIIREESAHTHFYRSMAAIELRGNELGQRTARWVLDHFYKPVGQGSLAKRRTEHVIQVLFGEEEGRRTLSRAVTERVRNFPGFDGFTKVDDKIAAIASKRPVVLNAAAGLLGYLPLGMGIVEMGDRL